ncbi:TRAP transporter large permease subunit, partial [Chloroflexota bacterium]
MLLGLPVAFSLGLLAIIMIMLFWGTPGLFSIAALAYGRVNSFLLVAVPLFIFMAEVIRHSGITDDAFTALHRWVGTVPGGLAVSSQLACTFFAAVCGASTATTATIGAIAVPEMIKRKYDKSLSTGSIAAGGALGVLIPPSILMIVYAELAEVSVGAMFMGGIIPGIMLSSFFIAYIIIRCLINPSLGPPEKGVTWGQRIRSLPGIVPILSIAVFMMVAIYMGIATTAEVAGLGTALALLLSFAFYRNLNWAKLKGAFYSATKTTVFIIWILVAATAFGHTLGYHQLPQQLAQYIADLGVNRWVVIVLINIILIFLGCVMDPIGIIMVLAPVFLPLVESLGFDMVWFGIVYVVNMEMAVITPPLGMNLFVMKGIAPPEVTMWDIIRGALPFMLLELFGLALVIIFPQIALWLPSTMR